MPPSPIDLTTVIAVKSWVSSSGVPQTSTSDDGNIQLCITAASRSFLRATGTGPANWATTKASPFTDIVTFTESYNGNDKNRLFLRNAPIISVISLTINNIVVPQGSVQNNQLGWVIDNDGKSIWIVSGSGTTQFSGPYVPCGGLYFRKGRQNIQITYTAGYPASPTIDLLSIPNTPGPFTVQTIEPWLSDLGVTYFSSGVSLTPVQIAPGPNQYYVLGGGQYMFNPAQYSQQVLVNFKTPGTPEDIQLAMTQLCALNYKRRSWIDQKSQAMAQGGGTIVYRDWEMPPEVLQVIKNYTRAALL